ncbi:MAG: hypothetical protein LUG23_08780 [Oscillospiraceae bacterium]|nr:hypothetical protein [Oscillospiraceae bacterium]
MNKFMKIALAVALAAVMCVSAVADTAVPSIQQKAAPEVSTATATDADGNEVTIDAAEVVVTAFSDADSLDADAQEALTSAYEQILESESLEELVATIPEGHTAAYLFDHTAAYLFDISVTGDAAAVLAAGGSVTVTMEVNLGGASEVAVLHNYSGSNWREEPSEVVGTNKLQVTFTSTSPFVITVSSDSTILVSDPAEGVVGDTGVDVSGATTSSAMPYVVGGVACIVVAGVLLIVANKKKVK